MKHVLLRNCKKLNDTKYQFLLNELRVPHDLLSQALVGFSLSLSLFSTFSQTDTQGLKARMEKQFKIELDWLLQSSEINRTHMMCVLLDEIAPEEIQKAALKLDEALASEMHYHQLLIEFQAILKELKFRFDSVMQDAFQSSSSSGSSGGDDGEDDQCHQSTEIRCYFQFFQLFLGDLSEFTVNLQPKAMEELIASLLQLVSKQPRSNKE